MLAPNTHATTVLLVDDEPEVLELTRLTLGSEGVSPIRTIQDSRQVLPYLTQEKVAVIVLDIMMPHISGNELMMKIVDEYPNIPVIVMTASDDVETAVECLKGGAFDYLLKPVEPGRLVAAVEKALKLNTLQHEVSSLKEYLLTDRLEHADAFSQILTRSKKMRGIFQYAEVISKTRQPILITGETGVGKELMACAIHRLSGVKGDFVPVNVAGLDDVMFSDTLFGHRRGAFTTAEESREGLISRAAGGTLFLDEIGDLDQKSQVKLLRLLQGQEYYPLGSDVMKSSEAHIILATNHDLEQSVAAGRFRKDLYYRLYSYHIHVPPLRERREDIPVLLEHFLVEAASTLGKPVPAHSPELADALATRLYPGNVRELKALVTDAVARHTTGILTLKHFAVNDREGSGGGFSVVSTDKGTEPLSAIFGRFPTIEEMEEYMIGRALEIAAGNRTAAALLLGMSRQALHRRARLDKVWREV
jgi:DNA-binding NtrC family response regulator